MRALITGAATGIGAATAARLASEGAEIVAIDIAEPKGSVDQWLQADMTDPAAIAALPLTGRFDTLVNAAGLPPRDGLEVSILALNFLGLRQLTERVLPMMPEGGAMVHIASKAGARWRQNLAQVRRLLALEAASDLPAFIAAEAIDPVRAYDLSKETVIYWTKAETQRLQGLGLRANTVSPAAIDTGILADFVTAFGARAEKGLALMGRPGTAEEVAEVCAFLAGPHSRWIKSIDIPVDGGLDALLEMRALAE